MAADADAQRAAVLCPSCHKDVPVAVAPLELDLAIPDDAAAAIHDVGASVNGAVVEAPEQILEIDALELPVPEMSMHAGSGTHPQQANAQASEAHASLALDLAISQPTAYNHGHVTPAHGDLKAPLSAQSVPPPASAPAAAGASPPATVPKLPAGRSPSSSHLGPGIHVGIEPQQAAWRAYLPVGATAAVALLVVGVTLVVRNRPPPPPEVPNPLSARVLDWQRRGLKPTGADALALANGAMTDLAEGTHVGVRRAFESARSAVMVAPDDGRAIAAYAYALAWWPDRVDVETLDEAMTAVMAAIGEDPQGADRALLESSRAWLQFRLEHYEAARQAATKAVELAPQDPLVALAAAVVRVPTRPDEAVRDLAALRARADAPWVTTLWQGEAELRAGNVGRALALWQGSLSGQPRDVAVLRRLARLAADMGDYQDATDRLQSLSTSGWACAEDRLLLARLLSRIRKDNEAALVVLDAGLADAGLTPLNQARLLTEKAAVATLARKEVAPMAEVSRWLDAALDVAPDLPELLYVAALVDERAGAIDKAVASLEAATELAPDRPEPALRLALLTRDENSTAVQVIAAAQREAPTYVPLYLAHAWLALQAGNNGAAADAIRRAADQDPERYVREHRLDAFVDLPQTHANLARLLTTASQRHSNSMLITATAMALYFADDLGKADRTLGQALKADPDDVGARLYRAVIALTRKKVAIAKKDLQAALKADSQHVIARLYQARLLLETKRAPLAERICRDLLDKNPIDVTARLGLAQALAAQGKREAARAEAQQVLGMRATDREALRFLVGLERRTSERTSR